MSDEFFLDSNIFVYLFDDINQGKRKAADELVEQALSHRTGTISHQVVQEVLNVLTGKIPVPLGRADAKLFMKSTLTPLWKVHPRAELFELTLDYRQRLKYSFYDSLIVAAAVSSGCRIFYTEDLQDGREIDGLTIVNPFVAH